MQGLFFHCYAKPLSRDLINPSIKNFYSSLSPKKQLMLRKCFKETLQDIERNINIAREWMNVEEIKGKKSYPMQI